MEIRFARKEDKPVLMNLWGYCFTDGDAYIRWNFDHRYREENTLVSVEDNEICGMVQLIPGRFWMDEVEINASFVEGVAVAPHKRSCGVAKAVSYTHLSPAERLQAAGRARLFADVRGEPPAVCQAETPFRLLLLRKRLLPFLHLSLLVFLK